MKTYMVILLLLLFEISLNFGHTLSKIELKNETEIYEIKEDQSALLITHPEDQATKLREIIYYHIIERPYHAKDLSHDKIEPDFEKRFFTNSHSGIQFEKKDCHDDEDASSSEELDDDSSQETDDDSNSSESNEENDSEQSSDKNDQSKVETNDEDKSSSKRHGDNDSIMKNDKSDADDNEKSPIDADSIKIDIRFSDFINTTEGVAKVERTTDNVTADPKTENEALSETPLSRSKREINHSITGKEKSAKSGEGLNHAEAKTLKREVGTYGMTLTGNKGVVWNDIKPTHIEYYVGEQEALTTSRPDVLMPEDISTTESAKKPVVIQEIDADNQGDDDGDNGEEDFIDEFAEIEKIFDKLIDKMDKTSKSDRKQENQKDADSENSKNENNRNGDDNDDSGLDPKEIEKTFIEILQVYKELTGDGTRNPADTEADDTNISEEKNSEEPSFGNFLRTPKEQEDVANATTVKLGAKLAAKRNDRDKEINNKDNDSKQQQFVKELLKNKYFWAWLKDASAAYLEILKRKFDAVIKTEVENQIEQYFKEHKNENCKEDKEDQVDVVQGPVQNNNATDENVKGNTSDTTSSSNHNASASNDTTAESINESNETSSEISTKKHKEKPSEDKNTQSPVKIQAQNLFGSSVGSGKVTNIFIYNINKAFDLENIKPIKNGTDGVFVFGLDDKKPEQEKEDASDKIPDTIPELETVEPDISLEHNKAQQTSTAKQEAEKGHPSLEKDKIVDNYQVKDKDNVEHSTDKVEVIPSDQTFTEVNIDNKTSTEKNKEDSAANTEKPVEVIKDDNKKEATTEKVEAEEDLNDTESDKSKETAEVE